jgi:hypothetical protein
MIIAPVKLVRGIKLLEGDAFNNNNFYPNYNNSRMFLDYRMIKKFLVTVK